MVKFSCTEQTISKSFTHHSDDSMERGKEGGRDRILERGEEGKGREGRYLMSFPYCCQLSLPYPVIGPHTESNITITVIIILAVLLSYWIYDY